MHIDIASTHTQTIISRTNLYKYLQIIYPLIKFRLHCIYPPQNTENCLLLFTARNTACANPIKLGSGLEYS